MKNPHSKGEPQREALPQQMTNRERLYWSIMRAKSGVLYLEGMPGVSKSAILNSIAVKNNLLLIDLRLATMDEVDLGVYPYPVMRDNTPYLSHLLPEWALLANSAVDKGYNGALIVFEELNRASLPVRNAALGILLERRVGFNFVFNGSVYMAATGNLGLSDNTDVEEFDTALSSRLIRIRHEVTVDEWIENFAAANVHPVIVSYLKNYPSEFYPEFKKDSAKVVNPRTWTFFSDLIKTIHGMQSTPREILQTVRDFAYHYLGTHAARFIRFVSDAVKYDLNAILNDPTIDFASIPRETMAEIAREFVKVNLSELTPEQLGRGRKFFEACDDDLFAAYIQEVLRKQRGMRENPAKRELEQSSLKEMVASSDKLKGILQKIKDIITNSNN